MRVYVGNNCGVIVPLHLEGNHLTCCTDALVGSTGPEKLDLTEVIGVEGGNGLCLDEGCVQLSLNRLDIGIPVIKSASNRENKPREQRGD